MRVAFQAAHEDKFSSMAKQMGRWVDQVLGPGFRSYSLDEGWTPAINVCESDSHYCIIADLAGMNAEEMNLRTQGGKLTISGHRPVAGISEQCRKMQMGHMEIDHGPFCRTIELPRDADADRIDATYRSGYLWIMIPKKT